MKSVLKDNFREVKKTLNRFLAILAIIALSTAFFVGIKTTSPDMKLTADLYYKKNNLMDLNIISNVGFNDTDIKEIANIEGIDGVMPSYSVYATANNKNEQMVFKVMSLLPSNERDNNKNYLNHPDLIEGRLPENSGECVIEQNRITGVNYNIGDKITLASGNDGKLSDKLQAEEYTVVGIVTSPLYVLLNNRGTTTIGSGNVSAFMYINSSDFKMDYYTDVYVKGNFNSSTEAYTTNYDDKLSALENKVNDASDKRAQARYDEIKADAESKYNEKKREYDDSVKEANSKITDGEKKLVHSQQQIDSGKSEIQNKKNELNNIINANMAEVEKTFNSKYADYNKSVSDANAQFTATEKQLKNSQSQIDSGNAELQKSKAEFEGKMNLAQQQIKTSQDALTAAKAEYNNKLDAFNTAKQNAINKGTYDEQKDYFDAMEAELNKTKAQLDISESELNNQIAVYEKSKADGEKQFQESEAKLNASQQELNAKKSEYEKAKVDTEKKLSDGKTQLDNAKASAISQVNVAKKDAESQISTKEAELKKSQDSLNTAKEDFEKTKVETEEKLADGQKQLDEAKQQISDIPEVKWYVISRNENPGYVDYGNAADRMDSMSTVFPVIFILVAILICITSMSRMVEEQRMYIGTMKALGYDKLSILSKFIIYGVTASVIGGAIGIIVGFNVLPKVIFNSYAAIYTMPNFTIEYDITLILLAFLIGILVTGLSALVVCLGELNSNSATLMRPRAPKAGKVILLERIPFIWKRLKFTHKVTARNIFRYKSRFLMTIAGVGGCTALLLVAFGLNDSISTISTKQFKEIYKYEMTVALNDGTSSDDRINIVNELKKQPEFTSMENLYVKSIDVDYNNKSKSVTIVVPENSENICNFIDIRTRENHTKIDINNDGVIVTEKLAKMLGLAEGDKLTLTINDTQKVEAQVIGIAENYLYHYVYMSSDLYKKLTGSDLEYNQIDVKLNTTDSAQQENVTKTILQLNGVAQAYLMNDSVKKFDDTIKSIFYIVLVLIIAAALLSFIVLYTLTSININERMREIATIKVLGFYDREVASYVFRENIILTIIGAGIGLLLGSRLVTYVVSTAEIDMVMFSRQVFVSSYAISFALTLLFALLVNIVMIRSLRKINMVEALKTVE